MATQNSETKHELNNSENSELPTNIVINIDNEENSNNNETETKIANESDNNNLENGHNNTKHNNLETENKNIKNENGKLKTENKNMNNENGTIETEHADGKHENKDTYIENSNLQTDHDTIKNEKTTSNSKTDNFNENSKIKNEDSTIRNENGNVNNENNIMRKQNGSFYPENGAAKLQISELLTVQLPTRTRMSFMEEESAKEKLRLALLKQCAAILKQGDQRYTKESLHKTFQDVDLLERIYRLFDTDNKEYLVQDDWFEFLKQRLTDEKQIDLVEQLESVAYVLCGNDFINLDAFQLILQNKVVTNKLFRVLDTDGDGYTTADEVMEFISTVSSSRPRVGFDKASVDRLEELFKKTVGDQKEITKEQFRKIMESKNPYFTERVFQIFDEDNNGTISLQEFITAVHQFAGNSPQDKIRFLFKVYDMDNDGLIQHRELQHVMKVCMEENGMLFSESQLLELTGAMFEDADLEKRGAITYEAFIRMLDGHGGLLENITTSIDRWLVPPNNDHEPTSFIQKLRRLKPYQLSLPYIRNNYVLLGYLAAFFIVNLVLFVTRCVEYRESNGFVIVARGCGQCLNFNCAWVLVLMLRHCITTMRVRGLGAMLPLDHHIYLHKLTGMLIAFYSALHTAMHLSNFSVIVVNDPEVNSANYTLNQWLFTSEPGLFGLVGGWANPTGFVLLFLLAVMFVCSQSFVRRRGSFKIFYWTHLLYIPFWVVLILHAPNFYKWFIVPGAIYFIERVLRYVWMMSERSKTYISSGILLPSRVTHLVIKRPSHFDFHAGDYVFVNIPAIAMYEWHPFTISSAPELEGYIWLHVRGVGEWTNRLYAYFEKEQARLQAPPVPALENGHEKLARSSSGQSTRSIISKGLGSFRKKKKVSLEVPIESHLEHVTTEFDLNLSPISKRSQVLSPQRLLEKSISMPDVQKKAKKLALRDFLRSESMIDHLQVSSEMQELSSYKSPAHHKDLEHRFRYMRTEPPIIAFKTPSFEECERRRSNESIITLARRRLSKTISPDKDVETPTEKDGDNNCMELQESAANLPVGKPLELYIDGPYGAASSHIFQSQHAALIAAGIGVTPFASILQSIMYKYWQARQTCVKCGHCWTDSLPSYNMRLRKVDFFWINREQRSFEWFVSLLSQLEMEQAEQRLPEGERFLEMHMYITSALQRNDMKAVGLQLALDLLHEKEKRDLITGLKTRTNAGRPNWDKVFKQLQDQNKGKVTVFYCGPPQLARTLKIKCSQYGFNFRKEVF